MNDAPNTTHWKKGDVVVHDADAKRDDMLMIVVGYTRSGLCKTQYVDKDRHSREAYSNDLRFLHDPFRPDIRARWKHSPASASDLLREFVADVQQPIIVKATYFVSHPNDILNAIHGHRGDWVKLEPAEGVDDDLFFAWLNNSIWRGVELRTRFNQDEGRSEYFMRDSGHHAERELP